MHVPVSLGEAIDKLSILDIKMDKITDARKLDVEKEYNLLYKELRSFIEEYHELYKTMKKVNLEIWDMMNELRDGSLDETAYLKLCKKCIEYNDVRFRVKNKINQVSKSELKEQKSYRVTKVYVETDDNNLIQNLSFMYDEVHVYGINTGLFAYDKTVHFLDAPVEDRSGYETCSKVIEF
jgi:hypothetical protein